MRKPLTRLTEPLVRENGALRPATWDEALDRAAAGFRVAAIRGTGEITAEDEPEVMGSRGIRRRAKAAVGGGTRRRGLQERGAVLDDKAAERVVQVVRVRGKPVEPDRARIVVVSPNRR